MNYKNINALNESKNQFTNIEPNKDARQVSWINKMFQQVQGILKYKRYAHNELPSKISLAYQLSKVIQIH